MHNSNHVFRRGLIDDKRKVTTDRPCTPRSHASWGSRSCALHFPAEGKFFSIKRLFIKTSAPSRKGQVSVVACSTGYLIKRLPKVTGHIVNKAVHGNFCN